MNYIFTTADNPDFIQLCFQLDEFLNQLAGGEAKRTQYIPLNQLSNTDDVIIAYNKNQPVGCASIRKYNNEKAEVKRVFIKKEYRGKGISKDLMRHLEEKAIEKGYKYLVLETGKPLIAATHLYHNIGYHIIPNYGNYKDMSESICMEKELSI